MASVAPAVEPAAEPTASQEGDSDSFPAVIEQDPSTMLKPKRSSSARTSASTSEYRKPMKKSDQELLEVAVAATGRRKKEKKDRGEKKQRLSAATAERPAEKKPTMSANVLTERTEPNEGATKPTTTPVPESKAPAVQEERPSVLSFLVPDEPPTPPADGSEKPSLVVPPPKAPRVTPPTPPQINVHRANNSLSSNSSTGTVRGPKHSRHPSASTSTSKPSLDTIFSAPEPTSSASSTRSTSPRPPEEMEIFLHPSRHAPPPPQQQQQQQQQQLPPQQWYPPPPALPHSPHSPGRRAPPLGPGSRSDPSTPRPKGPLSPSGRAPPPPSPFFPQQQFPGAYPPYPYEQQLPAYPPPRVDYEAQLSPPRAYPAAFPSPANDGGFRPDPFLYLDSPGPNTGSPRSPLRPRQGTVRGAQLRPRRRSSTAGGSGGLNKDYYHPANKVRGSTSASSGGDPEWESDGVESDSSYSPTYKTRTPKQKRLPPTPIRKEHSRETGYQQLSTHLTRNPQHRLYNKFTGLSHRLLLHMQDELLELEGLLTQLDAGNPDSTRSRRGMMNTPEGEQRLQILGAMSWKLGQYQAALKAASEMESLEKPAKDEIETLRGWLEKERPVVTDESGFLRDDMVVVGRRSLPMVKVEVPVPSPQKIKEHRPKPEKEGKAGEETMNLYQMSLLGLLGTVCVLLLALVVALLSVRNSFSLDSLSERLEEAQVLRRESEVAEPLEPGRGSSTGLAVSAVLVLAMAGAAAAGYGRAKGLL